MGLFTQPNTLSLLDKNSRSQGLSSRYIYGNNTESHGEKKNWKKQEGRLQTSLQIAEDQALK